MEAITPKARMTSGKITPTAGLPPRDTNAPYPRMRAATSVTS